MGERPVSDRLPRGVTATLDGRRAYGECIDLAERLIQLDAQPSDDRTRREQVACAARFLTCMRTVERVAATGDIRPEAPQRLARLADDCRKLIAAYADPIERPEDGDWEAWARTLALGPANARRKLRSIAGKAIVDGLDLSLVRRLAQLENADTCEPPLTRAAVDEIVDALLLVEAEKS
jgi:hypothetical protein